MSSPFMWYLNRGTGVTVMVLLSLTTVLGILATGRRFTPLWPRFVTQGFHRVLAGVSLALLGVHVVSAVVDEYVDIRWWQALAPVGATYKPVWLGMGTLALDFLAILTVTSVLRDRLPHRVWFVTHLLSYAAWLVAIVHGLGIGTDANRGWMTTTTWACCVAVALATVIRLGAGMRSRRSERTAQAIA